MSCRRNSPPRRWQPLDDAERDALLPFVLVQDGPGRPLSGARCSARLCAPEPFCFPTRICPNGSTAASNWCATARANAGPTVALGGRNALPFHGVPAACAEFLATGTGRKRIPRCLEPL